MLQHIPKPGKSVVMFASKQVYISSYFVVFFNGIYTTMKSSNFWVMDKTRAVLQACSELVVLLLSVVC